MPARTKERAQFFADVITTAVEGGISYWACVSRYKWEGIEPSEVRATIHEQDPDGSIVDSRGDRHSATPLEVTVDGIAKAFALILSPKEIRYLSFATRQFLRTAYSDCESGNIDAGLADVIVQLAVFGEVVYG